MKADKSVEVIPSQPVDNWAGLKFNIAGVKYNVTKRFFSDAVFIQTDIVHSCLSLMFLVDHYGRPIVIGQAIIFSCCDLFFLLLFSLFSSPNLSRRRLDVSHTSAHGVALVRI